MQGLEKSTEIRLFEKIPIFIRKRTNDPPFGYYNYHTDIIVLNYEIKREDLEYVQLYIEKLRKQLSTIHYSMNQFNCS